MERKRSPRSKPQGVVSYTASGDTASGDTASGDNASGGTPAFPQDDPLASLGQLPVLDLIESAPDAVVLADEAGRIMLVNRQCESLFGYTRAELLGQAVEQLVPERLRAAHVAHRSRYFATPATRPMGMNLALFGRRKDGSEFPVEISLSPLMTTSGAFVMSSIRDVTERRLLERRTRDALAGLLALAEALVQPSGSAAPRDDRNQRDPRPDAHGSDQQAATGLDGRTMHHLAELTRRVLHCPYIGLLILDDKSESVRDAIMVGGSPRLERRWHTFWQERQRLGIHQMDARLLALRAGEEVMLDLAQPPSRERRDADALPIRIVPMVLDGRLVGVLGLTDGDQGGAAPGSQPDVEANGKVAHPNQALGDTAEDRQLRQAAARLAALVLERERHLRERRAYEEAESRRALLQIVLDELPGGVYLVRGPTARLVLANRAAETVWGATWPAGLPMADFLDRAGVRLMREDGQQLMVEELATLHVARTGEAVRQRREVVHRPDGTLLPILINAVALDPALFGWASALQADSHPHAGDVGAERGALVVLQDVSAIREAEQLKDDFISIATHELRNPLSALKGFASMLSVQTARGHGPSLADWQIEAIAEIDEAAARLVALTNDLLDVTRIQAGRLELHRAEHDLVALARRVVGRLQVTTALHPLAVRAAHERIMVSVDGLRVEQVLLNLVGNAIKYSPNGGDITLSIEMDSPSGQALLSVRDLGIGIPVEQQARLFVRFARADNAHEHGIEGTGLGLYLCRELVEHHGGHIWFSSGDGKGTTFYVTLPLASPSPSEKPQDAPEAP